MKTPPKQKSFHVKTGDEVMVIAGGAKGRRCKITKVNRKRLLVYVEGVDARAKGDDEGTKRLKEGGASSHELDRFRLVKPQLHHVRKSQQNPNGALLWLEGPIHISNVMKAAEFDKRRAAK
jgi:ribosomal protein L24